MTAVVATVLPVDPRLPADYDLLRLDDRTYYSVREIIESVGGLAPQRTAKLDFRWVKVLGDPDDPALPRRLERLRNRLWRLPVRLVEGDSQ